jgi:NAD(P)-dependent dehydrogenase (short-subunit alcohol dehydrogenase family)
VLINTASIAAYDGQIGQTAYAASKRGIVENDMLTQWRGDLARRGDSAGAEVISPNGASIE